jgi:hypothetical protein
VLTVCCFLGAFDLLTFMSCVYRGFVCISVCGVCISCILITGLLGKGNAQLPYMQKQL